MKSIVTVIVLALFAISCGSNKKVYAPPFEEETGVEVVEQDVRTQQVQKQKVTNTKPVVSKEEKVTMTHGDIMKKYNVIVGSFANETNAINLRNRLINEGYNSIILKNDAGMSRVSIAGFDQEGPARTELARIREAYPEFADAWLLIVKDK